MSGPYIKSYVKKAILRALARENRLQEEIKKIEIIDGSDQMSAVSETRITNNNGIELRSFFTPHTDLDGSLQDIGAPIGTEHAVLDYLLRFKYPHYAVGQYPLLPGGLMGWLSKRFLHGQHIAHRELRGITPEFLMAFEIRPGDTVIEAGAYIGFGTVGMAQKVLDGRVISFEPIVDNCRLVKSNLSANGLQSQVVEGAIGGKRGKEFFWTTERQKNSLNPHVVDSQTRQEIDVYSLEDASEILGVEPSFIILTINGAELDALTSARSLLMRCKYMRIICPGWYSDEEGPLFPRIQGILKECGFACYVTTNGLVLGVKGRTSDVE